MKISTSELTGIALDWAVAKCEVGADFIAEVDDPHFYSTDWTQGGPIIEREKIHFKLAGGIGYVAWISYGIGPHKNEHSQHGPTPLIAAMRCYVASQLGDEIDVPDELK